jgi:hypothetical protein
MSKFLLNLLPQISKALVNSKIQFLIQKFLFLLFGPADLVAHSAVGPAGPAGLSPVPQDVAHRPAQAAQPTHAIGVIVEVRFLLGFMSSVLDAFSLSTADAWVPHVSSVFPTAPRMPSRLDRPPPSSFPPLIPFKLSLNEP